LLGYYILVLFVLVTKGCHFALVGLLYRWCHFMPWCYILVLDFDLLIESNLYIKYLVNIFRYDNIVVIRTVQYNIFPKRSGRKLNRYMCLRNYCNGSDIKYEIICFPLTSYISDLLIKHRNKYLSTIFDLLLSTWSSLLKL
jgi:hypothetical protein